MKESIGIFDSGFGGLTVMRAVRELLPNENIVYVGDTAHLPYGNKSPETIRRYALSCVSILAEQNIKLLIIACHTACAYALDLLKDKFPFPVIGVIEPSVEQVLLRSKSKRIAILGTHGTIESGVYQRQLLARHPEALLTPIACPLFVPLVEEGYTDHSITALTIKEYLAPVQKQNSDTVLLGCTHYPLLKTPIERELGKNVTLIDPAETCAKMVCNFLDEKGLKNNQTSSPTYKFFVSDDTEKFRIYGEKFLGAAITDIVDF